MKKTKLTYSGIPRRLDVSLTPSCKDYARSSARELIE